MSAALNMTQDKQRRACSLLQAGLLAAAVLAAANSVAVLAVANSVAMDTKEAVRSFFCQGMGDRSFASEAPLAVQKAARSVWEISSPRASGSGFFLSPRLFATNFHIVEAFGYDFPDYIDLIQNGEPGKIRIKRLISASAIEDVAVLETDRDAPFYLNLREKPLSANEDAFVLGYPGGAFHFLRKTGPLMNFGSFMQFPFNFIKAVGLSGGPAVDSGGSVSGIFHTYSGNFGLFTKSNHLKGVLEEEPPPGATRCSPTAPAEECLDEAKRLAFEKAAEGDALAQYSVGYRSLLEEDFEAAVHWLDRSAEQGYAPAQDRLGAMYLDGDGVEQDFETAAYWIIKAVAQGHVPAQERLASMYWHGKGVKRDLEKAAFWTAKAAEQGDAEAQFNLGFMYLKGKGVAERDLEKAAFWTAKAAEQGDAEAQFDLGLMYLDGDGVEKSLEKAVLWVMRAAEQDYAPALRILFFRADLLSAALRRKKLCAQPMSMLSSRKAQ